MKIPLESGADPNLAYRYFNRSPWTAFVLYTLYTQLHHRGYNSIDYETPELDRDKVSFLLFEQLILAGADLDILYQPPVLGEGGD